MYLGKLAVEEAALKLAGMSSLALAMGLLAESLDVRSLKMTKIRKIMG